MLANQSTGTSLGWDKGLSSVLGNPVKQFKGSSHALCQLRNTNAFLLFCFAQGKGVLESPLAMLLLC